MAAGLLDLALPTGCIVCGDWMPQASGSDMLCGRCQTRLRPAGWPRCVRCHHPRGTGRLESGTCRECAPWPEVLATARHAYLMEHPADALVHALKYEGWAELAPLMARAMAGLDAPWREADRPARLVPVPTTAARERKRGYNQSERLASALARVLDLQVVSGLERTGVGPTQVELPASERRANVRSAFRLRPDLGRRLSGGPVILVDDVLTTGSTACAAALALAQAGIARVDVVTFTRAVSFRPVER